MSYAIIRNTNYKKENLAGLYKHNERKNTNYSNKDINKNNSIKNYSIKNSNTTYANALKLLQKEYNLQGRIIKTTNVVCEFIITSDKEFFEKIGEEETKRYFKTAYDFVAEYKDLGEQYILSAKIHMDESTPHMHIVFVPVIHKKDKDGNIINKIACSEYWKGRDSYRKLQDSFYEYVTKAGFNLERGKQREIEHLSTEKLKQITDYENIKYEQSQEQIKPAPINNTALILKQNQELIKYTNKLKLQLSKSYKVINQITELQKENTTLKYENQKLKEENHKLKKYISRTFDVVKYLFDMSTEQFRRIVDNFIKSFEKQNKILLKFELLYCIIFCIGNENKQMWFATFNP